jgi:hypothetical protein
MTERDEQRSEPDEIGVCHVCDARFDSQQELSAHLMNDHEGEVAPDPRPA